MFIHDGLNFFYMLGMFLLGLTLITIAAFARNAEWATNLIDEHTDYFKHQRDDDIERDKKFTGKLGWNEDGSKA